MVTAVMPHRLGGSEERTAVPLLSCDVALYADVRCKAL